MSKSNIIHFQDNLENMAKYPDLLSVGNVIQLSPLPNFEHIQALINSSACPYCGGNSLVLISYEISEKVSALFARCKNCKQPTFVFFGEETFWSADVNVIMASAKDEEYRNQLQNLECDICHVKLEVLYSKDPKNYDVQRIVPIQTKCPSCAKKLNWIFWDSPQYYFDKALTLADEVIQCSPRAGLVFLISALETFLQKAFLFQSTSNKFLIEKRKVNFQSLQDARDIYVEFMGIDLTSFVKTSQWDTLAKAVQERHYLVHNAGFDKRFQQITVSSTDLQALRVDVVELVTKLNQVLQTKGLV
jgi:thymidine kinase